MGPPGQVHKKAGALWSTKQFLWSYVSPKGLGL